MRGRNILIVLVIFIINVQAITRDDILSIAAEYSSLVWQVVTPNPRYPIYAHSGDTIIGEAYSYGDKATTSLFLTEIANGLIPRNWKDNFNDSTQAIYTGIDCSGYVTRCWQFTEYLVNMTSASALKDYTIPVVGEPKAGDLWWKSTHVFLNYIKCGENWAVVYEANALDEPYLGNRVQFLDRDVSGFEARSIFPQFANETPADGGEVYERRPEISVEVTGSGFVDVVYLLVDGEGISFNTEPIPNGIKVIGELSKDLEDGKHTVEVYAMNTRVRPYEDWFEWSFEVRAEYPVVVSTTPSDKEQGVDISTDIVITFSKEMDRSSVNEQTVLFDPPLAGGFTTSWDASGKTVTLRLKDLEQDLEFLTDYKVTVTDEVKDINGVRLDGDRDGKPEDV